MASAALSQLTSLLDALQSRVAVLEKGAGVTPPAAAAGGTSAVDDEPSSSTREFDELVKAYGEELAKVSAAIGGDVTKLVRGGAEAGALVVVWRASFAVFVTRRV